MKLINSCQEPGFVLKSMVPTTPDASISGYFYFQISVTSVTPSCEGDRLTVSISYPSLKVRYKTRKFEAGTTGFQIITPNFPVPRRVLPYTIVVQNPRNGSLAIQVVDVGPSELADGAGQLIVGMSSVGFGLLSYSPGQQNIPGTVTMHPGVPAGTQIHVTSDCACVTVTDPPVCGAGDTTASFTAAAVSGGTANITATWMIGTVTYAPEVSLTVSESMAP